MKAQEINHVFLARDVYKIWKRHVSRAEFSITVYTPYFDRLLGTLLGNARLENAAITVVTELNPESLLQCPGQLWAMKRLLSNGRRMLALPRLHAKVLLVDDKYVTVGSQNFTSYARNSRECTVAPVATIESTIFQETLVQWRNEAAPVDASFVDLLLARMARRFKAQKELVNETRREFDQLFEQNEDKKRQLSMLQELERKSRIAHGTIFASLKRRITPGMDDFEYDEYLTLIADSKYDLTKWLIEPTGSDEEKRDLQRCYLCPVILLDSSRMGFARIARTRITYFRESVSWSEKLSIDDHTLNVLIKFPRTETFGRNIIVEVGGPEYGDCKADFLFTGESLVLKRRKFFRKNSKRDLHQEFVRCIDEYFSNEKNLKDFFAKFFKSFKYKTLGKDSKNAESFLKGHRFRVCMIEFAGTPVLTIKQV